MSSVAVDRANSVAHGSDPSDLSEARHLSDALDEALQETFPASDPIAVSFACTRWPVASMRSSK